MFSSLTAILHSSPMQNSRSVSRDVDQDMSLNTMYVYATRNRRLLLGMYYYLLTRYCPGIGCSGNTLGFV